MPWEKEVRRRPYRNKEKGMEKKSWHFQKVELLPILPDSFLRLGNA